MSDAAIVLCGGRSRRMGKDKHSLDFGGETLLDRTVRVLRSVVDEVVVVAREGTDVPATVRDPAEGLGPLAGLAAGLEAMKAGRAFLAACDAPFLLPEYVRLLFDLAEGHDAAVPLVNGYHMTTAAVYGKGVLPVARRPRSSAQGPGQSDSLVLALLLQESGRCERLCPAAARRAAGVGNEGATGRTADRPHRADAAELRQEIDGRTHQ